MEDLEKRTYILSERYRDTGKIDIPRHKLRNMIIYTGIATILSGAALAYATFPHTIESIIEYFTQRPF